MERFPPVAQEGDDEYLDYASFNVMFGSNGGEKNQRYHTGFERLVGLPKGQDDQYGHDSGRERQSSLPNHLLFGQMKGPPERKKGTARKRRLKAASKTSSPSPFIELLLGSPSPGSRSSSRRSTPSPFFPSSPNHNALHGMEDTKAFNRFNLLKVLHRHWCNKKKAPSLKGGTKQQVDASKKEEDLVIRLLRMIMNRENYLEQLQNMPLVPHFSFHQDRRLWRELVDILLFLRKISLEIVSLLDHWRKNMEWRYGPFLWHHRRHYLVKMTYDTDFLADVPYLEEHLGICLRSNPFYASVLVNGSSAKISKGKSRDYDRDADDPAVALYTIDPLTNGGDVQIKLKIQRACRVLHHELLRMRSSTHQKQQQNQQETDGGIDDPSSRAPLFSASAAGIKSTPLYACGNPNYPPGPLSSDELPPCLEHAISRSSSTTTRLTQDQEDEDVLEIACLLGSGSKGSTPSTIMPEAEKEREEKAAQANTFFNRELKTETLQQQLTYPTTSSAAAIQNLCYKVLTTSPKRIRMQKRVSSPSPSRLPSPEKASEFLGLVHPLHVNDQPRSFPQSPVYRPFSSPLRSKRKLMLKRTPLRSPYAQERPQSASSSPGPRRKSSPPKQRAPTVNNNVEDSDGDLDPEVDVVFDIHNINTYLEDNLLCIKQIEEEHLLRRREVIYPAFRAWRRTTRIDSHLRWRYERARQGRLSITFSAWHRHTARHQKGLSIATDYIISVQKGCFAQWLRLAKLRFTMRQSFHAWKQYRHEKHTKHLAIAHHQARIQHNLVPTSFSKWKYHHEQAAVLRRALVFYQWRMQDNLVPTFFSKWKYRHEQAAVLREAIVFWKLRTLLGINHRGAFRIWYDRTQWEVAYGRGEAKAKELLSFKVHRALAAWRRRTTRNVVSAIMERRIYQRYAQAALKVWRKHAKVSLYAHQRGIGRKRPHKTVYARHLLTSCLVQWIKYYQVRVSLHIILLVWEHFKTQRAFQKWRRLYGCSRNPIIAALNRTRRSLWSNLIKTAATRSAAVYPSSVRQRLPSSTEGVEVKAMLEKEGAAVINKQLPAVAAFASSSHRKMTPQPALPADVVTKDASAPLANNEGATSAHADCPHCRARLEANSRSHGDAFQLSPTESISPLKEEGKEMQQHRIKQVMPEVVQSPPTPQQQQQKVSPIEPPVVKPAAAINEKKPSMRRRNKAAVTIQKHWHGHQQRSRQRKVRRKAKSSRKNVSKQAQIVSVVQEEKRTYSEENTPGQVMVAIQAGDINEVTKLIHNGALSRTSPEGISTLWTQAVISSAEGTEAIVRLLATYLEINTVDEEGRTPLMICLAHGGAYTRFLPTLLELGSALYHQDSLTGKTAMHLAVETRDPQACALLVGYDERHGGQEGIINVADYQGNTPLHLAVRLSAYSVAQTLLTHKAIQINALNQQSQNPICLAVTQRDHAMVEILLPMGADPMIGGTLLSISEGEDNRAMLETILTFHEGYYVNAQDYSLGNTLLHYACIKHSVEAVGRLLSAGADPDLANLEGLTPRYLAKAYGFQEEMTALLRAAGYPDAAIAPASPPSSPKSPSSINVIKYTASGG